MADDIFASVAKGFMAMGDKAEEIVQQASAISQGTARLRSELEKQDRSEELLGKIQQRHKALEEVQRALTAFLEKHKEVQAVA
jgi:DNA topoisomerase VI subunit B